MGARFDNTLPGPDIKYLFVAHDEVKGDRGIAVVLQFDCLRCCDVLTVVIEFEGDAGFVWLKFTWFGICGEQEFEFVDAVDSVGHRDPKVFRF